VGIFFNICLTKVVLIGKQVHIVCEPQSHAKDRPTCLVDIICENS